MKQIREISERFYKSSQSWVYERIIAAQAIRLRVLIRRNAYDIQSYVRGYALDSKESKWNLLVDRPIKGAACEEASYVDSEEKADINRFKQDAKHVIDELIDILDLHDK